MQNFASPKDDEPPVRSQGRGRRPAASGLLALIFGALLALATGSLTFIYFAGPFLRALYFHSQIGLQASPSCDHQFSLKWNRNSSVLRNATGARLTITHGPVSRDLSLDNSQLRYGNLLYSTNAPEVEFRLEIHRANGASVADTALAGSPVSHQSALPIRLVYKRNRGSADYGRALRRGDGLDSLLINATLVAARDWLFEPAILNDKPISTDYLVVSDFRSALP